MDSGKFGPPMSSSGSGDDAFGYFGGPPAALSPAGPVAYPYAAQPPAPAPASNLKARRVALGVGLVLVVVVAFFGWGVYQRSRPITMPASFAGQDQNLTPAAQATNASIESTLKSESPGIQLSSQIYGTGSSSVILGAARANDNATRDLTEPGLGPITQVGEDQCAAATSGRFSMCLRASSNLTVVVLQIGGTNQSAAALVDQAWGLF
jgi:hypothetical protein